MVYQKRLFTQQENLRKIESNYQKDLLKYSYEAQEAERKRIASDLHDGIGSLLSATRIYVHQLNPKLSPSDYQEIKSETTNLIDNAIDQVRLISHNLFPPNLDHLGLLQATSDFCQRIQKINEIDIHFDSNVVLDITKQEELAIYRIIQELVNNTLKHAQANTIKLGFNHSTSGFKLTYQDDGKGFNVKSNQLAAKGLGIKSIESRANSIKATFHIHSQPAEGMYCELIL